MIKLKIISLFSCALLLISCAHPPSKIDSTQQLYPTGDITIEQLQQHDYFFHPDKSTQSPADATTTLDTINSLQKVQQHTDITVFFGLWCHDSQREVPRLIRLLQRVNNPHLKLKLIALDLHKSEPQAREKNWNIRYTPTVIISRQAKELGRIVEKPETSLAQDLLNFIE